MAPDAPPRRAPRHHLSVVRGPDADRRRRRRACARSAARLETVPRTDPAKGTLALLRRRRAAPRRSGCPTPSASIARARIARASTQLLATRTSSTLIVCDFLLPAVNLPERLPCPAVLFTHNVEAEIWRRHAEQADRPGRRSACCAQQWRRMLRFEGDDAGALRLRARRLRRGSRDVRAPLSGRLRAPGARRPDRRRHRRIFAPRADAPADARAHGLHRLDGLAAERRRMTVLLPRDPAADPRRGAGRRRCRIVGRAPTPAVQAAGRRARRRGHRPRRRRAAVHRARRVYVVPLRIGGGTRLKIFEAMAMAKAVVSTTVGAEGLPVTDGARRRCSPTNRRASRDAVVAPAARPDARAQHRAAARALVVERYDWSAVAGRSKTHLSTLRQRDERGYDRLGCRSRGAASSDRGRSHRGPSIRNVMRVSVFGLGYVGSVSAASFAADGHEVVGVDVNAGQGGAPSTTGAARSSSRGSTSCSRQGVADGRLRATTDTAEAVRDTDLSLICVGTPSRKNGSLDLTYLERVCEQIGDALTRQGRLPRRRRPQHRAAGDDARRGDPGARARRRARSTATGFGVSVNPEFLREGTALKDFRHPPLTLVGHNHAADAGADQGAVRRRSTRRSITHQHPRRRDDEVHEQHLARAEGGASRTRSATCASGSASTATR